MRGLGYVLCVKRDVVDELRVRLFLVVGLFGKNVDVFGWEICKSDILSFLRVIKFYDSFNVVAILLFYVGKFPFLVCDLMERRRFFIFSFDQNVEEL